MVFRSLRVCISVCVCIKERKEREQEERRMTGLRELEEKLQEHKRQERILLEQVEKERQV